jgi:hypothetical protein
MKHVWTAMLCTITLLISASHLFATEILPAPPLNITLPLPSANSFSVSTAFGPSDGLLYVWNGMQILKQDAPLSNSFTAIGNVGSGSADAGPLAFSRDGSKLLAGNGAGGFLGGVHAGQLFTIPATGGDNNTAAGNVPYQDRVIAANVGVSNDLYFIDQGNASFTASSVSVFDAATGANSPLISNIPGASAAMTIDSLGRLYVGIGFGPQRGELRRFDQASLENAFATDTPLNWSSGDLFNSLDNNSGAGMFFDARGLLFVGGPNGLTVFDQNGNVNLYDNGGYTNVDYDPIYDRVLVTGYGNWQGLYPASAFLVPEPATWPLMLAGVAALAAVRRKRRA